MYGSYVHDGSYGSYGKRVTETTETGDGTVSDRSYDRLVAERFSRNRIRQVDLHDHAVKRSQCIMKSP